MLMSLVSASSAHATAIGVCDQDSPASSNGSCTTSVTLSGNILTLTLTNTTPTQYGGYLTADAFLLLPNTVTPTLTNTTNPNFQLSANPAVQPFSNQGYSYNWLLSATGGQWEGGGNPSGGIAAGDAATFTLSLAGDLTGLTEGSILTSEAIRFRGFAQGGSDKDLVTLDPVPEPATLLLLGTGLTTVAMRTRRRRKTE